MTFQSAPAPLLALAFCAMVETAAWMAAPSLRCRAALPTTTIGFLAWSRTCASQESEIHSTAMKTILGTENVINPKISP